MIDELSRRRADFQADSSVPVVLADGQPWHIPKPWIDIKAPSHEHDALIAAIDQSEGSVECVEEVCTLAAKMLLRNYELADDELTTLLAYRDDEGSSAWVSSVVEIACGMAAERNLPRWRRLTLWLLSKPPDRMLLEDANDLAGFMELTGRTIPRSRWAEEAIAERLRMRTERSLEGMI